MYGFRRKILLQSIYLMWLRGFQSADLMFTLVLELNIFKEVTIEGWRLFLMYIQKVFLLAKLSSFSFF